MQSELAPLRRAQQLLQAGRIVDDVVDDLRRGFGLSMVDAVNTVAEYAALTKSGAAVPDEPFARPYI